MRVINLFAGPGAGKSTTAAGLFFEMKCEGFRVELVTEYAKELVYEKDYLTLDDQYAVTMEQYRRLKRLEGEVDYAISDSPLLIGLAYAVRPFRTRKGFSDKVWRLFNEFDNTNYKLIRCKAYQEYGRTQTEEEVGPLDHEIHGLCESAGCTAQIPADRDAPMRIFKGLGLK